MGELADDPVYEEQILPLALKMLAPAGGPLLDMGCGEGRLMRALPEVESVGCDLSMALLRRALPAGPVVQAVLPDLRWLRDGSFASAAAVFVVEHVAALDELFAEVRRVLQPGGVLALVMNHPAYTPDGAGPLIDTSDGEVLWRWGAYFEEGTGLEPAGSGRVVFHHRPMAAILQGAAELGFVLERFEEAGLDPGSVAAGPAMAGQEHFPRVLAARWRRP